MYPCSGALHKTLSRCCPETIHCSVSASKSLHVVWGNTKSCLWCKAMIEEWACTHMHHSNGTTDDDQEQVCMPMHHSNSMVSTSKHNQQWSFCLTERAIFDGDSGGGCEGRKTGTGWHRESEIKVCRAYIMCSTLIWRSGPMNGPFSRPMSGPMVVHSFWLCTLVIYLNENLFSSHSNSWAYLHWLPNFGTKFCWSWFGQLWLND